MTPGTLSRHLFSTFDRYQLDHLRPANCKHGTVIPALSELVAKSDGVLRMKELGSSLEGRSINMVMFGSGEKRVLLWSQMHGDETTATLALMDIANFIARGHAAEKWVAEMLGETTVCFIPMLNPDGAERCQRWTAAGIDMNRDARVLATPEARLLRNVQRRFRPTFGFNLHDQELSSVGTTKEVTAIALLAPAVDEKRTLPMVRIRAMRVAALIARCLGHFIEGHIANYNDAYEARAFGDGMQSWGTSTVLIESGHWPRDPEKEFIRKLNYVGILTALRSIGDGSYQDAALEHYYNLAQNGKSIFDIIIRDVTLTHADTWSHRADIGLLRKPGADGRTVSVAAIGDLHTHATLETINGHGRRISTAQIAIEKVTPLADLLNILQLYHP